jgi:hypothetical protein
MTVEGHCHDTLAQDVPAEQHLEWTAAVGSELHKGTRLGKLVIGGLEIECAVLEKGVRVVSQRAFTKAIGAPSGGAAFKRRADEGVAGLPIFLAYGNVKPFIDADLAASLETPVEYIPKHGGRSASSPQCQI